MKKIVVLHNIRSAHNVGAFFRTGDGAGMSKIYLVGYTPSVLDRFGREQPEIKKTSLGATETVAWEHHENIADVLSVLKAEQISTVAVEQHERSIPYTDFSMTGDTAFIFGNEVEGVPENVCAECDAVIDIPMHGMKESLNVSVSGGVILYGCH